jgi:glycosyltransferase involved in cell wall biosynthesis
MPRPAALRESDSAQVLDHVMAPVNPLRADAPLRILAIIDLPWDARLGAARVWIELAEEWTRTGHKVQKFCLTDAYGAAKVSPPRSLLRQLFFPWHAARHIRRHAADFDVIDSLIGTVRSSKRSLRFSGLFVARSAGLYLLYDRFLHWSRGRWPEQPSGRFGGSFFHKRVGRLLRRNSRASLRHCDLLNLLNDDELKEARSTLGPDKPAIVQPNGLNRRVREALGAAALPPEQRLRRKKISFVGTWGIRKGSRDWPDIIRAITQREPEAEFAFLGTMADDPVVRRDLAAAFSDRVQCVSTFQPAELPGLLRDVSVGLFPSYIEGFGLAVVEQLACGIPTIAYDVPGPRQILHTLRETLLVPRGDVATMAERALAILNMDAAEYATLSAQCRELADQFCWERIAAATVQEYRAALNNMPGRSA